MRTQIALAPRCIKSTLEGAPRGRSSQMASAIQVHPNGRYVYVSNRAWDTETRDGRQVFVGGVNDIAVFEIDQASGEPSLIQHVDTLGIFPRTFGIDATGTMLVVGNQEPFDVRAGDEITQGACKSRRVPDRRRTAGCPGCTSVIIRTMARCASGSVS